jgi:hypothetical protein
MLERCGFVWIRRRWTGGGVAARASPHPHDVVARHRFPLDAPDAVLQACDGRARTAALVRHLDYERSSVVGGMAELRS